MKIFLTFDYFTSIFVVQLLLITFLFVVQSVEIFSALICLRRNVFNDNKVLKHGIMGSGLIFS